MICLGIQFDCYTGLQSEGKRHHIFCHYHLDDFGVKGLDIRYANSEQI